MGRHVDMNWDSYSGWIHVRTGKHVTRKASKCFFGKEKKMKIN